MSLQRIFTNLFTGAFLATYSVLSGAADLGIINDESWVTVNGTVVSATNDSFRLDYGEGIVTVEMDDWDWYPEGAGIIEGQKVTVSGRVDHELFESGSIEASSVYVDGLNTYHFASPADEEMNPYLSGFGFVLPTPESSMITLRGTVTSVDGREFMLSSGDTEITVDTTTMPYNPLDNEGMQRISPGDRVFVQGKLDLGFFDDSELLADYVVTLYKDGKRKL